jgi:hypothetical protein
MRGRREPTGLAARTFVLANFAANAIAAQPILYRRV